MGRQDWARYDPFRKEAKVRYHIVLPRGLKTELEKRAGKRDVSLSELIVHIIAIYLTDHSDESEKK